MKPRVAGSVSSPGRGVDFRVDLRDDDLGLVQHAPVEIDEHVAQMQLRSQASEQARRAALERDRFSGKGLIGQAGDPVDGVLQHARD